MKRIGTITAAVGLIFLGVWMLLLRTDAQLGNRIFSWWPILIVILGMEVLIFGGRRSGERRPGFNFLIIPIIIIFICVSMFQGITRRILNLNFNFRDLINIGEEFDSNRYKEIEVSQTFNTMSKAVRFNSNNISLSLKKSSDGKIKVEGSVFVNKSYEGTSYKISEKTSGDTAIISFDEDFVRNVKITAYIPEGFSVELYGDNLKFGMDGDLKLSSIRIDGDNSTVDAFNASSISISSDNARIDIRNIKNIVIDSHNPSIDIDDADKLKIKGNNSSIRLKNVKQVEIDSDNPSITVDGSTEILSVKGNNGRVKVDNALCRDIYIEMDNGSVDFETSDKNLTLEIEIDKGYYNINGEKKMNSNLSRKLGTGEGKIRVKMNNGAFNFSN